MVISQIFFDLHLILSC